jgi:hypothetical protein
MSTDKGKRLQNSIDALMQSYHEHPEIEHIGTIDLPAKENIIALIEDIQVLLFPGLIRQESFDFLNLPQQSNSCSAGRHPRKEKAVRSCLNLESR